MRSSIIVVSWNGEPYLADCLDALAAQVGSDDEVIVVDNGSTDGSASLVRQRHPQVRLIENGRNLGFAGGCNVGLRAAEGQALLLVNQDVVVRPGWLEAMLAALAAAEVGVVGGKLLYPDGTIQHAGGILHDPQALPGHLGYREADRGRWDAARDVEYVTGAAMGFRREMLERVGFFDEGFFPAFYEETDFCARARAAGYRVVYVPTAVAVHRETTTVEREGVEYHRWMGRGRLRFVLKHQTPARFHGDFVPAERLWLAAQRAPALREGLRAAYLDTLLGLRDMPRTGVLADEGSEEAVAEALIELRATLVGGELLADPLGGVPWAVEERPFRSDLPVLGPWIARFRALWNSVSTRWYVLPLLEQQNEINRRLALALAAAQENIVALDRELADARRLHAQALHALREDIERLRSP